MAARLEGFLEAMRGGLSSMLSDAPEDVAVRERLLREYEERTAKERAYYAEIERKRGITRAPGLTRFRPHRGGLAEALEEVVEVKGRAGLTAHLRTCGHAGAIRITPYGGDDDRIGWKNVHIVVLEGMGPVGFCEGNPE